MSDPARARYMLIVAARVVGVAVALAGLVLTQRATGTGQTAAAFAILIGGIGLSFYLPIALANRWRTPPP